MSNLVVHRASRLEALAAALRATLAVFRPEDPLFAQTVVVPHAGMGRWLRQFLATDSHVTDSKGRGIVANLDFVLPFEWLDRLEREQLPSAAVSAPDWQAATLCWHLDALLRDFAHEPALANAIGGEQADRQRFRLAEHLAGLFSQYLLYRRERVAGWEQGRETHWQARLWRALRRRVQGAHRGDTLGALLAAVRSGATASGDSAPHLLFGFNHLPADHLQLVDALSMQAGVHLFHPTPTFAPWGDLANERRIAGLEHAEALHLDAGHPLLAALGAHGQPLAAALEARSGEGAFGTPLDQHEVAAPTRLGVLQQSLRMLDADALLERDAKAAVLSVAEQQRLSADSLDAYRQALRSAHDDDSLRVHVCHSRLRELEALRDAMLARLLADPALRPRDIIVMVPDIDAYARLLPAVFDDPAYTAWLPYQVSDRADDAQALGTHIARLLTLDSSRFGTHDLLDLFAVPSVSRRFAATNESARAIALWARDAGVSWGLDAHDRWPRAEVGAPDTHPSDGDAMDALHTWAFALDRLTAGYLGGGGVEGDTVVDGIEGAPSEAAADGMGAHASALVDAGTDHGAALATLSSMLRALTSWRDAMDGHRSVEEWVRLVQRLLLDAFFDAGSDDVVRAQLARFETALAALEADAQRARRSDAIGFPALREALVSAWSDPAAQPFLGGGITFCGMVPARALPFSMVCVLGLNDGEFPRTDRAQGLDLMQAPGAWCAGDRNQRDEDRYLFLESVMAARDCLHLSFRGIDATSGDAIAPSAPLAELMAWLDAATTRAMRACGRHAAPPRPWRIEQPLQPFAPSLFAARPGIATRSAFDTAWCDAARAQLAPARPRRPFIMASPAAQSLPESGSLKLRELTGWLRDPARAFVRDTLGIEQPWLGPRGDFDEPLDASLPKTARNALDAALIAGYWRCGEWPDALPHSLRRSGTLPRGGAADAAFAAARERLASDSEELATAGVEALIGAWSRAVDVDVAGDDWRVVGRIDDYFEVPDVLRRVRFTQAATVRDRSPGETLAILLEWALLRLAHAPDARLLLWRAMKWPQERDSAWLAAADIPAARLEAFVAAIVSRFRAAQSVPLWLPARTATALSAGDANARTFIKAAKEWRGSEDHRGEGEYESWRLAARAEPMFDDDETPSAKLLADVEWARATAAALLGEDA